MNKKIRGMVLASVLAVVCLLTSTVGVLSTATDGLVAFSASAATEKLKITTQPKSVTVAKGKTATVKVSATGEGLTYKWYYKNAGSSKFTRSTTVKGATYKVEMSASRHGRQLYCVITDKAGNKVTTKTVTISMSGAPKITTQPKSVTVANGKTATVKVVASGTGLTYKWYYKNAGSSKFSLSKTVKGRTYSVEMTGARHGRQVYCVVTNKDGDKIKSDVVTLSLTGAAKITTQPKSVTVVGGKTATVKVAASGEGLTYKWYYKNADDSKFVRSKTVKTATYSVEMSKSRHGRQLYCVVTDKYGVKVQSKTVTLKMKATSSITTQPRSVTVADGQTATVKVVAKGEGLTYKWYYKDPGDSKFFRSKTVKTAKYSVEMNKRRAGRQLYCVVTDKYGYTVQSKTVTLTRKAPVEITRQPVSAVAEKGKTLSVSVVATGEGLTYKWYYKNKGDSKFIRSTTVKTAKYSVEMSSSRNGRQLYCVVTDKHGTSVKTDTVTIKMGVSLAITKQPTSVAAPSGDDIRISFSAKGEGLTYTWYYKEKDSSKFIKTSSFTGPEYTVAMNTKRDGRQVYCVVTDKYGNSVKTDVVTMRIGTPVTITKQPVSVTVKDGETALVMVDALGEGLTYKWYYKNKGASKFSLTKTFTGVSYTAVMNDDRDGRQIYCVITDKHGMSVQTETVTLSMAAAYHITVDLGYGEPYVVDVPKSGTYKLSKPSRPGYGFEGWKTAAGKDFPSSGTIDKDVLVKATWKVAGTDTLQDLINRTNGGATEIVITGDIVINQPIYISYETKIYSNKNCKLIRDPGYAGDLFVVGKDSKGVTSLLHHRKAVLTLGGGKGTLTIDGNRENVKVNVVGSVVFAGDSCTVNIYDGVRICNNQKLGNERLLTYSESASETTMNRGGGAAIVNMNSVVNMYGGTIDNNAVKTEHTVTTDAQGVETKSETAGCGGAIYSNGSFNMYGGTIKNNEALRGGAVYMVYPTLIEAGTIQGNRSYTYGGAVSTSASQYANLYVGGEETGKTLLIKDNYSKSAGGALYSNTTAPIVILGNTVFQGNSSDYSGGAIYTGGSLVVRNTTFRGNSSYYSGGAVYFHNTKDSTWTPREASFEGCTFEKNSASLGGAITFSRSNGADEKATGVVATISDCRFYRNQAVKNEANPGNGGAVYVTQLADATITGCEFTENTAASSGGGVSVNGKANAKLADNTFTGNTAVSGGGMYLSVDTTSSLKNLTFTGNKAVFSETGTGGTGGAIYGYSANTTMEKLDIRNNTAAQHGGAMYLNAITLTLGADTKIEGNSAGDHGGAFYLTYRTNEDKTKTGSNLILNGIEVKGNIAKSGGAISIRTACGANLSGAKLIGNTATATVDDAMGGGAVYVGYGTLNLTNTTLDGNTSAYYGGAVFSRASTVSITGGTVKNSAGGTGAALYFCEKSTAVLKNVEVKDNNAAANGVLYINNGTLDMTNVTASGNKANQGGVLYTSGASTVVTLKDSTWSGNSAPTGGAIYMNNASVKITNATLTENSARLGGAIYNKTGVLTTEKVAFTDNAVTGNGGAIYLQGSTYEPSVTDSFTGNSAGGHGGAIYVNYLVNETDNTRTPSVLTVPAITFAKNTATAGGAISARSGCSVNLNGTILTENAVSGFEDDGKAETVNDNNGDGEGGGAIYVGYGKLTMKNVTATGNTASDFGGVVDAVSSPVTITGGTFSENSTNNGGVIHAMGTCAVTVNGAKFTKNASLAANTDYDTSIGGGVFHTIGGTLQITGSTLDGNTSANYGGVIHSNKTEVTINGKTAFTNNTGATGAVMHMRSAKVTLENISVANNTSNMNGVIYYAGTDITMDNVAATGNKAYQGGVLFVNAAGVTVKDSTFSGNSATNGGAIYSKGGATVNLENATMTENTASYGGAVYIIENSKLNLTGATFTKNSATKDGGAIYNKASLVTAADIETAKNVFTENTAKSHGGAIYVVYATDETTQAKIGGMLNMTGGTFTDNTALGGGAVSARTDCEASFEGTVFTGNSVTGDDGTLDGYSEGGGAVYVGYGMLIMDNVTAIGNTSGTYSGAVHLLDTDAAISDSTFTGNEAANGGAIYGFSGGQVSITDSTFSGNEATENAGAVYLGAKVTGELKNLVFDENHADGNGGALMLAKATVTTDKLDMQNNSAGGNGGAVYLQAIQMNIDADDVFKGNSAEGHGGAFYLTYSGKDGASLIGTNAVLENNTAKAGGAISSRSYCNVELTGGTLKGNKATAPQPDGLGGGAIYSNTNTLTLHGVTLEGNTSEYYGGAIYTTEADVTIDQKSVVKGNGAVTGVALYFKTSGTVTMNDITVTENVFTKGVSNGLIYVTGSVALDVTNLTATNNKSVNGGVFFISGSASGTIKDSVFTENTATDKGGVLCFSSSGTLNVTGNTLTKNTAKNGGAIYCENGVVNVSGCQLTENNATATGGAISVEKKGVVNVAADNTLKTNTAPKGGAVYLDLGGTANITGITLEGYTATTGGAISVTDTSEDNKSPSTLTLTNVTLQNNTAKYGGAIDVENGSTVMVNGGTMTKNTANLGGAIYNRLGKLVLVDTIFTENTANKTTSGGDGNGGAIVVNGGNVTGTATFENNTAENHAGAIYLTYVKGTDGAANIPGTANMTGGAFTNNTAMGGGAVSIRTGCSGTFENMTFTGNSVSGWADDGKDDTVDNDGDGEGGGAIYVGYGSVTLKNCTATGNTATDSFGGFLDAVKGDVTVNGGSFTGNTAPAGGAFYGINSSKITMNNAVVSQNASTFVNPYGEKLDQYNNKMGGGAIAITKGTLTISGTTLNGNKSTYYGGAIVAGAATVTMDNKSVVSGSTGKTGGAIYIRDNAKVTVEDSSILDNKDAGSGVVYIGYGTLNLIDVTATGNTANTGAVVTASGSGATVNVTGGTYSENSATNGGAIYINKSAKVNVSDTTFTKNTASNNGGAIYNNGSTLTGSGTNAFTENTAVNHGGAIYNSYYKDGDKNVGGVVTFTGGTFNKNAAAVGGAISARTDCSVVLTGTTFTANEAKGAEKDNFGGGAIYTGYGSLTLSGCTLDGNKTDYYGGAITAHGATTEIKGGTVVKNNTGATGAAFDFRNGGTVKLDTVSITDNTASSNGVVYVTGNTGLEMKDVTASGNKAYQGGVLYASGTAKVTITGGLYETNTATGSAPIDIRTSGAVTISGATFKGNTGKKGGALHAYGASVNVTVKDNTLFEGNSAPNGGAVYLDQGAKVTIDGSTLDGNTSTGDGGAIYVADTSKETDVATNLAMTGTTLQNNTSGARGGALATDSGSPLLVINATNCIFYNNTSTTSGGAVGVQCGNCNSATDPTVVPIVFTNCIFRGNTATTDGGAIDVRSGSCIKIDGMTAENNTATGNAAVVYVTSTCTRLYITGEISCTGNTAAKSGNFSYLYNNNYSTPPKLYTTHSNTATWYADVAGNKTNVVFDLTTLP